MVRDRLWRRWQRERLIYKRLRKLDQYVEHSWKARLQLLKDCKECTARFQCITGGSPNYGYYKGKCAKQTEWLISMIYYRLGNKKSRGECACDYCKGHRLKGNQKKNSQRLQKQIKEGMEEVNG